MPAKKPDAPQPTLAFPTATDFDTWLTEHHDRSHGIWLKFAKKASGVPSVTYPEALDIALCHGWIDGQVKRVDETWYLQRFTPRRPRSKWSKINRGKVAALIDAGRMRPAGLRQIEAAKADGRWDAAYDSPKTATLHEDFAEGLKKNKKAAASFAKLKGMDRYVILSRIQDAKKPETRARRIAQIIEALVQGKGVR